MTEPTAGARKAALIFIFITVLIDILAFGLIIPVLPHLVQHFVGGDTRVAAHWVGLFGTTFALIQFFSAPIQGALSDRYGRRPVILLSCLGLGLDFIFMALANSLPWLFVGRIISAIDLGEFHYGQCLRRRYHRAGKARAGLRHDRRGVRTGFHHRAR